MRNEKNAMIPHNMSKTSPYMSNNYIKFIEMHIDLIGQYLSKSSKRVSFPFGGQCINRLSSA